MEDILDSTTTTTMGTPGFVKRPTFLTVLCILTFVGSGLGLLGSIFGLIGASFIGMFTPQGTIVVQFIALVASGLCLFGAIRMWNLYKQGFILYVLGAVLSIVGSVISAMTIRSYMEQTMASMQQLNGMNNSMFNDSATTLAVGAAWTGVIMAVIINGLFIVLYGLNRKHLVK